MELASVRIEKPEGLNIVIGQSHFIKTAEDVYEAVVNAVPQSRFGVAFCEASTKCLVRVEGNDEEMKRIAAKNALALSAGHTFFIALKDAYPINILRALREVPEVCQIICATANEVDVIIAQNERGRGILGVIDGERSRGLETDADVRERREFLRKIGYKK
ncbi:MAG: adenosine monophosphate-protein transferase [Euryarchaeota archaeon]|nr:adenosine monophosphate-protein transferase [Euryarchaeota archaeon]